RPRSRIKPRTSGATPPARSGVAEAGGGRSGSRKAGTSRGAGPGGGAKKKPATPTWPGTTPAAATTSGPNRGGVAGGATRDADASNDADTTQKQDQTQNVGGNSSCYVGCGGAGAAQIGVQSADTQQWAGAAAISKQNAVNANVPVNVAGGDITSG